MAQKFISQEKKPLLEALFLFLKDTKKTKVRDYLKQGFIYVNGKAIHQFDHQLKPGDKIELRKVKFSERLPEPLFGVEILYDDEDLAVIYKPSGLLTISTEKVKQRTTFFAVNQYFHEKRLRQADNRKRVFKASKEVFIVHRLDKETSGVMVFAKNETVKFLLQENWREVRKTYLAVVEGHLKEKTGTLVSYLRENQILKVYSGPKSPDSKKAITHYRVLKSNSLYSLVEIQLETGRKHQIRVHFSDLGHPVAGDDVYKAQTDPIRRLALHAWKLEFNHPITGKPLTFEKELPYEMEKLCSIK